MAGPAGNSLQLRRKHRHRCGRLFLSRHFFILRPRRPFPTLLLLSRRRARGDRHMPPSAAEKQQKPSEIEEVSLQEDGTVSAEMLVQEISRRYAHGLQLILQLQCEALVRDLGVRPMICGVVGSVWLRFLVVSRVLSEDFVRAVLDREKRRANSGGRKRRRDYSKDFVTYIKHCKELRMLFPPEGKILRREI